MGSVAEDNLVMWTKHGSNHEHVCRSIKAWKSGPKSLYCHFFWGGGKVSFTRKFRRGCVTPNVHIIMHYLFDCR